MQTIISDMKHLTGDLPLTVLQRMSAGFDAVFNGCEHSAVVVAVSGGSDSLALLLLTKDYLEKNFPTCQLIAVTVDHLLRAESADEAQAVAALCKQLGVSHQILCWSGDKPSSGLASAARNARYDLLVQAAQQAQAFIILTGHTADDQVETYLMRREREGALTGLVGEGRGLAAMAGQTLLHNQVMLCRPLLSVWREELRDILRAKNIGWVDDPSNDNQAYERPRIRQQAKMMDKFALLAAAQQAGVQRRADNQRVAALLGNETGAMRLQAGDSLCLPCGWSVQDDAIAPLALSYLLTAIGGQVFLAAIKDCASLNDWLAEPLPAGKQRKTLHHCIIEKSRQGITIRRERRNLPAIPLQKGEHVLWDGRYEIRNDGTEPVTIAALSEKQLLAYLRAQGFERGGGDHKVFDRTALLSAPAIFRDGDVIGLPALSDLVPQAPFVTVKRTLACFDWVLSGYDFAVAASVKALLTMPFNHNYR